MYERTVTRIYRSFERRHVGSGKIKFQYFSKIKNKNFFRNQLFPFVICWIFLKKLGTVQSKYVGLLRKCFILTKVAIVTHVEFNFYSKVYNELNKFYAVEIKLDTERINFLKRSIGKTLVLFKPCSYDDADRGE